MIDEQRKPVKWRSIRLWTAIVFVVGVCAFVGLLWLSHRKYGTW
jgi:hypothetical protein